MADTIYKDIDLSLEANAYGDFPSLLDANAIRNTLYNNLLISSDEIPFDNTPRLDINRILFEPDNIITRKQIKDIIIEATRLDNRIKSIKEINIIFDSNALQWKTSIKIELNFRKGIERETIDFSLIFQQN